MDEDRTRTHSCPYDGVDWCDDWECHICFHNPEVAARRLKHLEEPVKKFKIPFTGYFEVYASSPEEALEKVGRDEVEYDHYELGNPIILEEEDDNELD